jgi:hypothetical protein
MKKNPIYFFIPPKEDSENSPKSGEIPPKEVNHYNTTIIHHHYPTSQLMDAPTIAKTAYSLIKPFLGKNKAISKITSDIADATNNTLLELWEYIKPIFIEEFESKRTAKCIFYRKKSLPTFALDKNQSRWSEKGKGALFRIRHGCGPWYQNGNKAA